MKFLKKKINNTVTIHKHELGMGDMVKRDWKAMVLIFFVMILLVFALDGYILLRVNQGDFFSGGDDSTLEDSASLDRKTLINAVEFFEKQRADYQNFRNSDLPEIDPSI